MAPYMTVGGLVPPQALLWWPRGRIAIIAPCWTEDEFSLILRYEHDMMNERDRQYQKHGLPLHHSANILPQPSPQHFLSACFKFAPKRSITLGLLQLHHGILLTAINIYRRLSSCHNQRNSPAHDVGVNAGHKIVKQIYKDMHIRRTMRAPQELRDGNISFDPTSDLAILVESMRKAHAQRLYSQNKSSSIIDMQNNSASTKVTGDSDSAPRLNFGENWKGVLDSFDFKNDKILNPKTPALYGILDEVNEAIAMLKDPDLVRTNSELEQKRRRPNLPLLCVTVGLFRLAGFNTVTVRPDHDANEESKVIAAWNDRKSGNEVFIANVKTMGTGVNMHDCCSKGMFLNCLMNAKSMFQIIGRLIRTNQKPVTFHLLKTKNSYYDNIERICCTK